MGINSGGPYGSVGFWGLNINLTNITNECCDGIMIYKDESGTDQVNSFTNNGTTMIGTVGTLISFPSIIRMNSDCPSTSLYVAPFTETNRNFGWMVMANTNKSICNDATGLWLGDPSSTIQNEKRWSIHYGCIDTKINKLTTISIYKDIYDITNNLLPDSMAGGGLYDLKRDLLWFYVPNFEWDHTIIFQINTDGTNMTNYMMNTTATNNAPFLHCHYSVYYDIYSCMCSWGIWCYYDPKTNEPHFLGYYQKDPLVRTFTLIDNGKNAVFVDENKNIFAMDVMKPDFKQIGTLHLPQYDVETAQNGAILLSFDG